jgi:hypothetical protein
MYRVYIINKKFYFGLNNVNFKEREYNHITKSLSKETLESFASDLHIYSDIYSGEDVNHLKPTDLNERHDCPVLLIKKYRYDNECEVIAKNVRLCDFGINQIISPHDIYVAISNFLSREKPVIDNRTDVQKIIGKGFDKKTSFRNVK